MTAMPRGNSHLGIQRSFKSISTHITRHQKVRRPAVLMPIHPYHQNQHTNSTDLLRVEPELRMGTVESSSPKIERERERGPISVSCSGSSCLWVEDEPVLSAAPKAPVQGARHPRCFGFPPLLGARRAPGLNATWIGMGASLRVINPRPCDRRPSCCCR